VYKFTGKERDKESEYDYFGARFYDARVGRWGTIDPLANIEPSKTPYHYTSNNPINRIDPEGLDDIYYKDGKEVDRKSSGFWDLDWLFGDSYYVQSESGNVEYNGGLYFEALSEATVKQFAGWNKVYANWESSYSDEGFMMRFFDAVLSAPSNSIDRYEYVLEQAPTNGKLDQKRFLKEKTIYVYNNIAMNQQEAGNAIFGSAINFLGIDLGIAKIGGQMYSVYANKRFDEYNEVQAYMIGYFNFNSSSLFFRNRKTEAFR